MAESLDGYDAISDLSLDKPSGACDTINTNIFIAIKFITASALASFVKF